MRLTSFEGESVDSEADEKATNANALADTKVVTLIRIKFP
jgi:hypothetical protein